MSAADFQEKYRAQRAHMVAVPGVLALVRSLTIDFNGSTMADGEPPREGLTCANLRTLVAEIDRLTVQVQQQQKDAREAEREFQREARDIAAKARWSEREERGDY